MIGQKEGEISMPEISLKPMAHRQFQDLVGRVEKKAFKILLVIEITVVILHKESHVLQDFPFLYVLVDHQFINSHILHPLSSNFPGSSGCGSPPADPG